MKRDDFRKVQAALGVSLTGIPNDETKTAFNAIWGEALDEYRSGLKDEKEDDAPKIVRVSMMVPDPPFPIVGQPFDSANIDNYLSKINFGTWKPTGITVHHMASPSLADRPSGIISQHMLNLRSYYRSLGWSSGPHWFTDEDQMWAFTPSNQRGVHAVSFNSTCIGIEMLGDFDDEDPWSGRGLNVLKTTRALIIALEKAFGIHRSALKFHRDDPKTSKTCPGARIKKERFLNFLAGSE